MGAACEDDILLLRHSKKKPYILESFTYFWQCESLFSQNFKGEFVIDGRMYNCTEQWMMQQECIVLGS